MATYRLTSVGKLIAKIFRDLKVTSGNWIDDAVEWTADAIEAIGAPTSTIKKVVILPIKNYRTDIPVDLMLINMVSYNPQQDGTMDVSSYKFPLRYESSDFPLGLHCDNCVNRTAQAQEGYYVNGNYIHATFETGFICLSYEAIPTDENCWPMFPDTYSFRQAIYWYVMMKMMEGGYEHSNRAINYPTAVGQWEKYCTQAENESKMPDSDRYESFKNTWVRLIPQISRHDNMFNELNMREELIRDGSTYPIIPTDQIIDPTDYSDI